VLGSARPACGKPKPPCSLLKNDQTHCCECHVYTAKAMESANPTCMAVRAPPTVARTTLPCAHAHGMCVCVGGCAYAQMRVVACACVHAGAHGRVFWLRCLSMHGSATGRTGHCTPPHAVPASSHTCCTASTRIPSPPCLHPRTAPSPFPHHKVRLITKVNLTDRAAPTSSPTCCTASTCIPSPPCFHSFTSPSPFPHHKVNLITTEGPPPHRPPAAQPARASARPGTRASRRPGCRPPTPLPCPTLHRMVRRVRVVTLPCPTLWGDGGEGVRGGCTHVGRRMEVEALGGRRSKRPGKICAPRTPFHGPRSLCHHFPLPPLP